MLDYQVKYWELQEAKRANRAKEELTRQSNAISQQQADAQTQRVGNDLMLGLGSLEVDRRNAATNYKNALTNARNADTNWQNAVTNFRNYQVNQQDANTREYLAGFQATESTNKAALYSAQQSNVNEDTKLKTAQRNEVISEILKNATQRSLMKAQTYKAYAEAFNSTTGGIKNILSPFSKK